MTTPAFRIEINLPDNPTIHGFVFEAPLFSEQLANRIKENLYPLLGMANDMIPTKCTAADQMAYDTLLMEVVDQLITRAVDKETLLKFDELIHLATSIDFRLASTGNK